MAILPVKRVDAGAAVLALLGACAATIETGSHFDETVEFGDYETFAWIAERPYVGGDPALRPDPGVESGIEE